MIAYLSNVYVHILNKKISMFSYMRLMLCLTNREADIEVTAAVLLNVVQNNNFQLFYSHIVLLQHHIIQWRLQLIVERVCPKRERYNKIFSPSPSTRPQNLSAVCIYSPSSECLPHESYKAFNLPWTVNTGADRYCCVLKCKKLFAEDWDVAHVRARRRSEETANRDE